MPHSCFVFPESSRIGWPINDCWMNQWEIHVITILFIKRLLCVKYYVSSTLNTLILKKILQSPYEGGTPSLHFTGKETETEIDGVDECVTPFPLLCTRYRNELNSCAGHRQGPAGDAEVGASGCGGQGTEGVRGKLTAVKGTSQRQVPGRPWGGVTWQWVGGGGCLGATWQVTFRLDPGGRLCLGANSQGKGLIAKTAASRNKIIPVQSEMQGPQLHWLH